MDMGAIGVRELGRHASRVVGEVGRSGRPVIVTVHGRPIAAVVPLDPETLEDYVLAYGQQFVKDRIAAERELASGQTRSLDDLLTETDD